MIPQRIQRFLLDRVRAIRNCTVVALPLLTAGVMLGGCAHAPEFVDEGVPAAAALPVNSFGQLWSCRLPTDTGAITKVYVRDNFVFAYTDSGFSYVVNKTTGEIIHSEEVRHGADTLHPPVILKDWIVYPTTTSLEVYDKTGEHIKSKELSFAIRSNAVGSKTFIYLGADFVNGGRLVAVDLLNQYVDHRWELMYPHASISSGPALLGDIVYSAAENGDIVAVSYDQREPFWSIQTLSPVVADLVADESGVYVASTDDKLLALNRNNGHVKWQYNGDSPLRQTPVVTKDFVFIQAPNVGMVALDKINGPYNRPPRWVAPDVTQILSEDDKYVYALRSDNVIIALDKPAGRAAFTSKRHDFMTFSTNTKDGTIYVVTTGNRLLALNPVLKPGQVGELSLAPPEVPGPEVALGK